MIAQGSLVSLAAACWGTSFPARGWRRSPPRGDCHTLHFGEAVATDAESLVISRNCTSGEYAAAELVFVYDF